MLRRALALVLPGLLLGVVIGVGPASQAAVPDTPGTPIPVGDQPTAIAITPDGATAYVANLGSADVTPISVATNVPGTPIPTAIGPQGIAITPDGATAYVTNAGSDAVTPITVATNTPGTPIPVGVQNVRCHQRP
jgi:YVTN family beta-propeller protein